MTRIRCQLQVIASDLSGARSHLAEQAKEFLGVTPFTLESVEATPIVRTGTEYILRWRVEADAVAEIEA